MMTSGDPGLWPRPDVAGQLQQLPPGLIQPGITDDQGIFSRGAGASRSGALASRPPVNPRGTEVSVNQENFVSGGIAPYVQPLPLVAVTPQTIPPNTNDSDVFSFLGGAQPARSLGGHAAAGVEGPSALQLQSASCGAPLLGTLGGLAPTPPELLDGDAPPQSLSPAELNMLMKSIQVFVPEFPKLEMGDSSSRAGRLLSWRISVDQAINPAGPHLIQWWKWCQREAEKAYKMFLKMPIHQREAVLPTAPMPEAWLQVEAWIRPRILDALPKDIRDWFNLRARLGNAVPSHFLVLKTT